MSLLSDFFCYLPTNPISFSIQSTATKRIGVINAVASVHAHHTWIKSRDERPDSSVLKY